MESIETFDERFHGVRADVVAVGHPSSKGDRTPPSRSVAESPVAVARVEYGRWLADCPFGCGGAEVVSLERPVFFCCECRNAAVGHQMVRVQCPVETTRAEGEEILLARPDVRNRHWHLDRGESVADLAAENKAHGLPLKREAR